jgi:tRNA(His) 5'-end guanylyltransferase
LRNNLAREGVAGSMTDSLGDRIKRYESVSSPKLLPRTPLFIRVDGKAFHSWTRALDRPFDGSFIRAMVQAARYTAAEMQGFKLGYVQSDEATFMLSDYDSEQSQGWFGYELNKIVSVSASLFAAAFNTSVCGAVAGKLATFDSRAFSVPLDDAPNVFVWRQKDWGRNSVQMLTRAHFSHRELTGKKTSDMHEMLHSKGINWADLPAQLKNGTFIHSDGSISHDYMTYEEIQPFLKGNFTDSRKVT